MSVQEPVDGLSVKDTVEKIIELSPEAFIILGVFYILLSTLVSLYICFQNNSLEWKLFFKEFITSFIALLLLPLILNAIGNDSLNKFISLEYTAYSILELMAYSGAAALAGRAVIKAGLDTLKLNEVKKDVDDLKQEQEDIIDKQAKVDSQDGSLAGGYDTLLNEIYSLYKSGSVSGINVIDSNFQDLNRAQENRHINIYGKFEVGQTVRCKLTKLGRSYLDIKSRNP